MALIDALLADAIRRNPSAPLVTYYDDYAAERTELSALTVDNWAAKTANLIQEEFDITPGERVAVLLPAHWQTLAILLAIWRTGAVATTHPRKAVLAFTDMRHLDSARLANDVVVASLDPMGRGLATPVSGALDYTSEVRNCADVFISSMPLLDDMAAVDDGSLTWSAEQLVSQAKHRATELGLRPGDRLLSTLPWRGPHDWLDGWLSALAVGATLVQCVGHNPKADLNQRAATEHVTVTIGTAVAGIRQLTR